MPRKLAARCSLLRSRRRGGNEAVLSGAPWRQGSCTWEILLAYIYAPLSHPRGATGSTIKRALPFCLNGPGTCAQVSTRTDFSKKRGCRPK
jgi:hypothetical protein